MKIQVSVKDPGLMDTFNDELRHLSDDEKAEFDKCKKLIKWGEYIKVEFDSETGCAALRFP